MKHPSSQLLHTALGRMAGARGVQEMLDAVGDWVDLGLVDVVAVWLHDPARRRLCLAAQRGLEGLETWRIGPPEAGGVLWRAIERVETQALDLDHVPLGLAVPLRASSATSSRVQALRDTEGAPYGTILVGTSRERSGLGLLVETLGPALARAREADADRWRAAWFDALVPLLADGLIVAGPDGEVYAYSDALQGMVGWTREQVAEQGWTRLVYPDPSAREAVAKALAALTLGQPSRGTIRELATASGKRVQAEVYSANVPNPAGGSPAFVGVLRDVTQRRDLARQRTRDEALQRLGRMAGGVAHEFNNLLGAIMGHAELVALSADATPDLQRRARLVVSAAQRGGVLSKQLLAFSGATIARLAPVELSPLIVELAELVRPAMSSGVELVLDDRSDGFVVEADPVHLQQALTNLVANGSAAARSEVVVTCEQAPLPEEGLAYLSSEAPSPRTLMGRIAVTDDGPGFTPEALGNLFEPFWSGRAGGHGLGLAAVRGIVGLHGGAISVAAGPNGHGATVALYLRTSERPELVLPRLVPAPRQGHERIWLVDDEEALLDFASIHLHASGYDVRTFSCGSAVVDAVRDAPVEQLPDVLVIDVRMPGMDGPATVRALADLGVAPLLLWTSGYSPDPVEARGRFLQKPYTGSELATTLGELVEGDQ